MNPWSETVSSGRSQDRRHIKFFGSIDIMQQAIDRKNASRFTVYDILDVHITMDIIFAIPFIIFLNKIVDFFCLFQGIWKTANCIRKYIFYGIVFFPLFSPIAGSSNLFICIIPG